MRLGRIAPGPLFLFLQEHFETLTPELAEALRTGPRVDLLPAKMAHLYRMVPLRQEGNRLVLAVTTADDPGLLSALEELTGLTVDPLICPPCLVREALERFYGLEEERGVCRNALGENVLVLSDREQGIVPDALESLGEGDAAAAWLRSLVAEAIRRRSREILLEPLEDEVRIAFRRGEGEESLRTLPRSIHGGITLALEQLSRMEPRGRTVPREGRFNLRHDGRTLAAVATALPSLQGDVHRLSLLEERIRQENLSEMLEPDPETREALERALSEGKGLLLLAAPERHHRERILSDLVAFLMRRDGAEGPIVAAEVRTASEVSDLFQAAGERLAVASIQRADSFDGLDWLLESGLLHPLRAGRLCGILGARFLERSCEHCRRRLDLLEELPTLAARLGGGEGCFANVGCRVCRGAGALELEPVFEFLPGSLPLDREPRPAKAFGERRRELAQAGVRTLFSSAMARAAAGQVDVRGPLRLLFHEGRGAA